MTPSQPEPICHAMRTEALLAILAEYLGASAETGDIARMDRARHLAEAAARSAARTTRALDMDGAR